MSNVVPFLDLAGVNRRFDAEFRDAIDRVARLGQWILGPEVAAFEAEFASFCGAAHAVGVGNGLEALELVLRAWGVGAGDEVVVPGNTFIATWLAVSAIGATPVPVDPDPHSLCIGAAQVEPALTPRTRVIVPVHLYGRPAPMSELMVLAARHGIRVLEDAAQAHGARLDAQCAGALGDAAAFSFYPAKNLGALGDGGMVTARDTVLAGQLRRLRNYGGLRRYEHDIQGRNSRLDELQAALLRAKLPILAADNERRAAIARHYCAALAELPQLSLPPADTVAVQSSWHLFVVRHPQRDALARRLADEGIATQVHYPKPPHQQPAYAGFAARNALPLTESLAREVLSLPIGPTMSDAEVERVTHSVRRATQALAVAGGAR